jgi:hypothetical protein
VEVKIWFADFSFGCIRIDGGTYDHDVVIDAGQIRERKKKLSEKFRDGFGHIPLSIEENLPWKCCHLVVGIRSVRKAASDEGCEALGGAA